MRIKKVLTSKDDFFSCTEGEEVLIRIRQGRSKSPETRLGYFVWAGDLFVCIWLCSLAAPNRYGYRECFYYKDLVDGNVVVEEILVKGGRKLA